MAAMASEKAAKAKPECAVDAESSWPT